MALDLSYTINNVLTGYDLTAGLDGKKFEIQACDDLDEEYTIRTSDGDSLWMNNLIGTEIRIEEITSPEKGLIEVKVRKNTPHFLDMLRENPKSFLDEVAKYFSDTLPSMGFRMTESHLTEQVDTSYMAHNSEGDEIEWVEQESEAYIGTTYILDGPTMDKEEFYTDMPEEWKAFIIRKLEAIFGMKGAWCEEKEGPHGMKHYEFKIKNY